MPFFFFLVQDKLKKAAVPQISAENQLKDFL